MSYNEFKRWLKKLGATFETHRSGSSHSTVRLNGQRTIFPEHGSKEIGTKLVQKIKKDLGVK
ncbi:MULTISPECIES: type II toxin-antitoxin system HicA family toxin [Burkholderia cepacia complex]|uniref:type II toxin-antitoxin system HicA family toxin n=1 Tax=Burkholderia cepacia complex TaxID=87882 RepID=UPI0022375B39|nr:type II toxin-antitoxin system HicA family toxin [Burkholderia cenocepacia]MCW5141050.1 type II toxin-antitoxin system HicA family toxin [Burkholderia cenocepacia]MCW5171308.1 type II toxin-antitoxin system HicA family toxin [Burkholderia cenocepacia]